MDGKHSTRFRRDLYLPARDRPIAQDANALIVERMPFPAQIARPEDRELVFWKDGFNHFRRAPDYGGPILG